MATIISRKQLYERVWQQPITHIAKEFGISDVGLRKLCKRHDIPTPAAGHWAKKAHGKPVAVTELPSPDDDHPIRIWKGSSGDEPEAIALARGGALAAVLDLPLATAEHPIVERTLAKLRAAKPGRDGLVRTSGAKAISVAVRPESLERAGQVLCQLAAAGEAAGLVLKPGDGAMAWHCAGETVAFELAEAADQVEHVATDKELAAHAKWQREREEGHRRWGYWSSYGEPKIAKWEQQYNGRLAIRLEGIRIKSEQDPWGKPIRCTFADSRTRDIMRMIPSIVGAIAATAAAKRINTAFDERRRVAELLAAQQRAEVERRRLEWQQAGALLDELLAIHDKADGLRRLLASLGTSALPPRTHKLMALAEVRLADFEAQLTSDSLERKLEAVRMFSELD